jgi:hypothetical protein
LIYSLEQALDMHGCDWTDEGYAVQFQITDHGSKIAINPRDLDTVVPGAHFTMYGEALGFL